MPFAKKYLLLLTRVDLHTEHLLSCDAEPAWSSRPPNATSTDTYTTLKGLSTGPPQLSQQCLPKLSLQRAWVAKSFPMLHPAEATQCLQ